MYGDKKEGEQQQRTYQRRETAECAGEGWQGVLGKVPCRILRRFRNEQYQNFEKQGGGENWKQSLLEKSVEGAVRSLAFLSLPASSHTTLLTPHKKTLKQRGFLLPEATPLRGAGVGFHTEGWEVWILSTEIPFPGPLTLILHLQLPGTKLIYIPWARD